MARPSKMFEDTVYEVSLNSQLLPCYQRNASFANQPFILVHLASVAFLIIIIIIIRRRRRRRRNLSCNTLTVCSTPESQFEGLFIYYYYYYYYYYY
jgi:hypothetical protein